MGGHPPEPGSHIVNGHNGFRYDRQRVDVDGRCAARHLGRVVSGMPLLETLPVDAHTAQWPVWGTTARIVVTDPAARERACAIVVAELAAVDAACSRFRDDSEIQAVRAAGGRPVRVSPLLAELVAVAVEVARRTGGRVDPTVGNALVRLGYDRDFTVLHNGSGWRAAPAPTPVPGWQRIRLSGDTLTVPEGLLLDLGATGKAYAADRCAARVALDCGVGVLVSLGGDIATAGPEPEGGWRVLVQDGPGEPSCVVGLPSGTVLATSSTRSRRWGTNLHHILDPRTCQPAQPLWRTVSVRAADCVTANALSTGAVVSADGALEWLRRFDVGARLVRADGTVRTVGGWAR
jgi:FAD:protein FMN transferase